MSIKAHWGVWLAANLPRECTTTTDFSSARIAPYNFALGAHMQRVYIASAANAWWWWQTPTSSSLLHCAHDLMAGRNMSAICCSVFFYAEAIRCVDSCRRWSGYVRFLFSSAVVVVDVYVIRRLCRQQSVTMPRMSQASRARHRTPVQVSLLNCGRAEICLRVQFKSCFQLS